MRSSATAAPSRWLALDGSIDWLCLPDLDSPSVFAAVLDAERGGRFALHPRDPYEARRRYLPDTNVLETTFTTPTGVVRVTDPMTLPGPVSVPPVKLVRRVEGLAGRVPMRWRVDPRFGYGSARTRLEMRGPYPVATSGSERARRLRVGCRAGARDGEGIGAEFEAREGTRSTIALVAAHAEPLVFPARAQTEARADATIEFWRRWAAQLTYAGPWRDAVVRSALALKLLVFAPSGAIAAAATASLPEAIGGERNWDYRYSWIRDSSFTLEALLQLGCHAEATSFFWWFMHATRLTSPRLQVFYRLDGGAPAPERTLPLDGYRGSRPVRVGNAAAGQLQLDAYGELLDTAFVYVKAGYRARPRHGARPRPHWPISCARTGASPTPVSGKCARAPDTTPSPRPCAGSPSTAPDGWPTWAGSRPGTPRGGARRLRPSADSSTSAAGRRSKGQLRLVRGQRGPGREPAADGDHALRRPGFGPAPGHARRGPAGARRGPAALPVHRRRRHRGPGRGLRLLRLLAGRGAGHRGTASGGRQV